jgi:putative glycerol-1-phosphate prenyltransferase
MAGRRAEDGAAGYREWRRIIKLDPARALTAERLEEVCAWDIDAVVVGGSGGYGLAEVIALLARLRRCRLPVALEVSDAGTVCPGFDLYLIPMVLNSRDVDWVIGHHQAAIKRYAAVMDWDRVVVEGYCILNPEATAARLSQARPDLGTDDVLAFARLAEHLLKLPIFYLEYSGAYGSPELVSAVSGVLANTRLWYGGGIRTPEQAREMGTLADAVVIGNALYEGDAPLAG